MKPSALCFLFNSAGKLEEYWKYKTKGNWRKEQSESCRKTLVRKLSFLPFLFTSWDRAPNSCHSTLAHKPFISVPGTLAETPSYSQLVCLLCGGHCYRDPCVMAFSSSFQYGGYYSFFSKQDFKQFAASWISKLRKRQMSSFFPPLFG